MTMQSASPAQLVLYFDASIAGERAPCAGNVHDVAVPFSATTSVRGWKPEYSLSVSATVYVPAGSGGMVQLTPYLQMPPPPGSP